jgi:hypothetical protein
MRTFSLLGLLAMLYACASIQAAPSPHSSTPDRSHEVDASAAFLADPSAKMTVSEWNALILGVRSLPGARVENEGPMLLTIEVSSPDGPTLYLFTQPAHPAHPAYLKFFPSETSTTTTRVGGGYAGSRSEFEVLVRDLLTHIGRRQ